MIKDLSPFVLICLMLIGCTGHGASPQVEVTIAEQPDSAPDSAATRRALGESHLMAAADMDDRLHLWDSQTVETEDGNQRLAAYRNWIYLQSEPDGDYRKLLPGVCPQWLPRHNGQTDRWFYVFLPVGYDGKSELWVASTTGQYLNKAAEGYFQVNSTPVLSPDAKMLAVVHRPMARIQRDRTLVSIIRINQSVEQPSTQEWVYEADNVVIDKLRFDGDVLRFDSIDGEQTQSHTISLNEAGARDADNPVMTQLDGNDR